MHFAWLFLHNDLFFSGKNAYKLYALSIIPGIHPVLLRAHALVWEEIINL